MIGRQNSTGDSELLELCGTVPGQFYKLNITELGGLFIHKSFTPGRY